MSDPLTIATEGVSLAQGILQFLAYVKSISGSEVLSTYFAHDGTHIEGSRKIEIEKHPTEGRDDVWWFSVREVPDYTFVRIPVNFSGIHELLGVISGERNPDARYWRWVAQQRQGVVVDGQYQPPNAKVNFIVVGYRPRSLIKNFSS